MDTSLGHKITTLPVESVFELGFSSLGTFIITWQRSSKDNNGDAVKNLTVWRVIGKEVAHSDEIEHKVVGRFVQKSQAGWNLQYTYDERYCARVVTNEIQFYQSEDLGTVWNRLYLEGIADFAVSPGQNHTIATFIPEHKVGDIINNRLKISLDSICRANLLLSRFSICQILIRRCLKKVSSRVIKSS